MRIEDVKLQDRNGPDVLQSEQVGSDTPLIESENTSIDDPDPLVQLLDGVARGDRHCFEQLYRRSRPALYAVARRVVGNPATAEEVLQEAYLTIWQKAHTYSRTYGIPVTWMSTLVRNKAIDRLRSQKRRHEAATVTLDDVEYGLVAEAEQDETQMLNGRAVHMGLQALRESHRVCILLAFHQGMTHAEVARMTNTPIGTVKSRIRKGLKQLRASIEG